MVEEERFEDAPLACQQVAQNIGRERLIQRLGAKAAQNLGGVAHEIKAAEFARVAEAQLVAIGQQNALAGVGVYGRIAPLHGQVSRHFEVNDERLPPIEAYDNVFGAAADGQHGAPRETGVEHGRIIGNDQLFGPTADQSH